jgi:mannose/fructose/N-acetylgalactosamine-specific phosphotransferase system component IIB
MKTDEILQKDVSNALKWKSLSISNIIVISNDGVVTPQCSRELYKENTTENSTRKIAGVKSVINKIYVLINS